MLGDEFRVTIHRLSRQLQKLREEANELRSLNSDLAHALPVRISYVDFDNAEAVISYRMKGKVCARIMRVDARCVRVDSDGNTFLI